MADNVSPYYEVVVGSENDNSFNDWLRNTCLWDMRKKSSFFYPLDVTHKPITNKSFETVLSYVDSARFLIVDVNFVSPDGRDRMADLVRRAQEHVLPIFTYHNSTQENSYALSSGTYLGMKTIDTADEKEAKRVFGNSVDNVDRLYRSRESCVHTTRGTAEIMEIHPLTVSELCRSGRLSATTHPGTQCKRISEQAMLDFIERNPDYKEDWTPIEKRVKSRIVTYDVA